MDLSEGLWHLLLGCCIGFVAGYIVGRFKNIEEKVDKVIENQEHPHRDEVGATSPSRVNKVMLFIAVLITVGSAVIASYGYIAERDRNAERIAQIEAESINRCKAAVETRSVQRATVEAVYNLASATLPKGRDGRELTSGEIQRYNDYIVQLNAFRDDMYQMIKPSAACAPYVSDDNVKPPPPPYPQFPEE